jgi:hypothetical protein
MRLLFLCVTVCCVSLCGEAQVAPPPQPALDRNAFTFTDYDLSVNIDPAQKRFEARGQVTLRNDSGQPQRRAAMQISSSLKWAAIKLGDTTLDFAQIVLDSDVDHTGKVNEATFDLPQPLSPGGSLTLEVGYSGFIALDTTRLRRIGTPADIAERNDWDRISADWTGLRGVGYVLWYPAELDPAELGDGNKVFDEISAWHVRHWQSRMELLMRFPASLASYALESNCTPSMVTMLTVGPVNPTKPFDLRCLRFGIAGPVFTFGHYDKTVGLDLTIQTLAGQDTQQALTAAKEVPGVVAIWSRESGQIIGLPDSNYAPYDAGATFITPLDFKDDAQARFVLAHPLQHANFYSNRPWIYEGLAHLAQLRVLEQAQGRAAVMAYLKQRLDSLALIEPEAADSAENSLINAHTEIYYRTKAMFVWWMLHDMVSHDEFQRALSKYKAEDDREPAYLQKLLEAESHRNLEPFFTDWVYRDRGLPDFKIAAVYPRQKVDGGYMVTVTVENTGRAGAEVPVIVHTARGDISTRLELLGKDKASARVEVPVYPSSVTVNDGSVPESDMSNNEFEMPKAQ